MTAYSLGALDQFLVSGANFTVTIVLARWLSVEEFGVMAVGQVLALYAGFLHVSLIGEPFSVNFSRFSGAQLDGYVGWNHVLHLLIMGVIVAVFSGGALLAWLLDYGVVARILACAAFFTVSCLAVWYTRRVYYALRREREALSGTLVYLNILGVGLWGLRYLGELTACRAMGVMAVAGGVVMIPLLRGVLREGVRGAFLGGEGWWRDHWAYAKWHLGGNAVTGMGELIAYPVLATAGGLGACAALRVVETFYAPFNQALTTMGLLILPRLAVLYETHGVGAVRHRLRQMRLVLSVGVVILMGALFWVGEPLVVWLFGAGKGAGLGLAVALYGGVLLLRVLVEVGPALFLRVIQDTRAFFANGWIVCVGGILLIGLAAMYGGIRSVIIAKILVAAASGVVFMVYAARVVARKDV